MKILVVEDEEQIRNICERALTRAGHQTVGVSSGVEALPRLAEDWDIVLTDLTMPGSVDGIEVLRQAKERTSADVILMTAYPELDTAVQAMRASAYDYLIKPFSPNSLLATIGRCLDRRRLSAELAREKALRAQLEQAHDELVKLSRIKETFGQFASPEVVSHVLDKPDDFLKRGERRVVTALFADVRSFTPFASRVPPEEAVATLNEIFEIAVEEINAAGGILNKFVGDGLMAVFGAPVPLVDHAVAAATAALKAGRRFEALSRKRLAEGREALTVCIGINTGEAVAGCLGTKQRTEYSVIGSAVNLASRLEGANKFFGSRLIVSEDTYRLAQENVEARPLGRIRVVGAEHPCTVYELLGFKGALEEEWKTALPLYAQGLSLFRGGHYGPAGNAFKGVLEVFPNDGPARLYLDLCEEYSASPPPRKEEPVFTLAVK